MTCWIWGCWRRYVTFAGVCYTGLHEIVQVHTVKVSLYVLPSIVDGADLVY